MAEKDTDKKPELHNDPAADQALPEAVADQSFAEGKEPKVADDGGDKPLAGEEAEKAKPRSKAASKRQEVFDRINAKRAEERAADEAESGLAPDAEQVAKPDKDAPETVAEKPKRKLKVDRQEVEVTEEERDALAQQGMAIGNRLTDLNQLLPEVKQALAEIREARNNDRSAAPASPQDARADETPAPPRAELIDKNRLRDVFDKIRVGDGDEGLEEFSSLFEETVEAAAKRQPQSSPEEIAAQVLGNLRAEAALETVRQGFTGRHPEIAADEGLGFLTGMAAVNLCLEEMRSIGVPEERLKAVSQYPELAVGWHRQYREQGLSVSSADEIEARAAGFIEQKYKLKEPAPAQNGQTRTEERVAEKRTLLQNEPRRASAVARQAPPVAKTPTDVVAEMRARRGFASRA